MLMWSVLSFVIVAFSSLFNPGTVLVAYIDPNTGGMLFQLLAVLFGVISAALLLFSGRIKGIYYRIRRYLRNLNPELNDDKETDNQ